MKLKLACCALLTLLVFRPSQAQKNAWKDDWKTSDANIAGQAYPKINSERRAQFKIKAPEAKEVAVNRNGARVAHLATELA